MGQAQNQPANRTRGETTVLHFNPQPSRCVSVTFCHLIVCLQTEETIEMQSAGGDQTAVKDREHEFSKISATQMCEMFQLWLDTLLPVSRWCYESVTGERWERTAGGWQGAYRTVEWKMWMKRSGISLSASLNGEFPTVAHFTFAVSRYPVKVTGGWEMIMWFSGVTFDFVTTLDNFHHGLLTLFCLVILYLK